MGEMSIALDDPPAFPPQNPPPRQRTRTLALLQEFIYNC